LGRRENAFEYNDYGDEFFIIIQGKCSVQVPFRKLDRAGSKPTTRDPSVISKRESKMSFLDAKTRKELFKTAINLVSMMDDYQIIEYMKLKNSLKDELFDLNIKSSTNTNINIDDIVEKWSKECENFDIPRLNEIIIMGLFKFVVFLTD